MRKIKRFKISTRQKEIVRKILRSGLNLRQAGLEDELALTRFVLSLSAELDPGTVYEFSQDWHWELEHEHIAAQEMFSACVVTLGDKVEKLTAAITDEARLITAHTILLEFLRTATLFVSDLIKEQAEAEECETSDLQLVYAPSYPVAAEPKLLREALRLEKPLAEKTLPLLLEKLNAEKIDVRLQDGSLTPKATLVFLIPWQKKKRKGKK